MLTYNEILNKIKQKEWNYVDKNKNTLLHLLMYHEDYNVIPPSYVKKILHFHPEFANQKNKFSEIPSDVLEGSQPHGKSSNRPMRKLLYEAMSEGPSKEQFYKSVYISLLEQYHKKNDDSLDYRLVPSDEKIFQKPTLFMFSGRGSVTKDLTLGFSRKLRKSLGWENDAVNDIQMLCARYPGNLFDLSKDCKISHEALPEDRIPSDHPIGYVKDFVLKHIRPLYSKKNLERESIANVLKNVRNINFVVYSYGAPIIQMVAQEMKKDMQQLGFEQADIVKIQNQIPALIVGPDINPKYFKNDFTCFHLLNTQDDVAYDNVKVGLTKLPRLGEKFLKTTLNSQPNQQVFLVNDLSGLDSKHTCHHIENYFSHANSTLEQSNTWKNNIIYNMLNNSLKNFKSNHFYPLPKNMDQSPKKVVFQTLLSKGLRK